MHVGSKFKGRNPFGVRSTGSYLVDNVIVIDVVIVIVAIDNVIVIDVVIVIVLIENVIVIDVVIVIVVMIMLL